MPGNIRGKSASRFGVEFYQALAAGETFDSTRPTPGGPSTGAVGVIGLIATGACRGSHCGSGRRRQRPDRTTPIPGPCVHAVPHQAEFVAVGSVVVEQSPGSTSSRQHEEEAPHDTRRRDERSWMCLGGPALSTSSLSAASDG